MKNKVIQKLENFNCPHDYSLPLKCVGGCTLCQMKKCWSKTFKRYELLVSQEPIYINSFLGYTFAFKKKEEKLIYNIHEVFEVREGTAFEDENGVEYKVINRELKFKMPILTHKWIKASVDKDTINMEFTLVKK